MECLRRLRCGAFLLSVCLVIVAGGCREEPPAADSLGKRFRRQHRMIFVRLGGACAGCAGAGQTLRMAVEKTLKEQVDPGIKVIQV